MPFGAISELRIARGFEPRCGFTPEGFKSSASTVAVALR